MPQDFSALWQQAQEAGRKAAEARVPTPMVVKDAISGYVYPPVLDGPCGFAWVEVRPGNGPLANWLKKQGLGRKGYGGGVHVWISDYQQSYEKKLAHAQAMAGVFAEAGINARGTGRLD